MDVDVDPERLLREAQEVAQHLRLRELGQPRRVGAPQLRGKVGEPVAGRGHVGLGLRQQDAPLAGARLLEHDRLVPAGLVEGAEDSAVLAHRQHLRERRHEPVDVGLRVHLGEAVEGALAQLRELTGDVLAAEDAVLQQPLR